MLVVLPLFLLALGGAVDFSRSLADRAAIVEIARTAGRAAARTWVVDEPAIMKNANAAVERYLRAAGHDPANFRTQIRLIDFGLGGDRYTVGVAVTVTALTALRPYHFLPATLMPSITTTGFYRLENARVLIKDSGG